MHPTPPATRSKSWRAAALVLVALLGLLAAGPALIKYSEVLGLPRAGTFDLGLIEVPVLAALQFFAAVSMAFVAYYVLFTGEYRYVRDCASGKLFENLTDELLSDLATAQTETDYARVEARRHIAHLKFLIRCARFVLALLPFLAFLWLSQACVNALLTAVPH